MVVIGALLALYGPVVPALRDSFGLSEPTAGLALAAQSLGAVVGVVGFHSVHHRIGNRALLASSYLTMLAGTLVFGLVGVWPLMLAGAAVTGLGLGGVDFAISRLFLIGLGSRGPALVNVAHGCFGLGTVLAPAVIAAAGPAHYGPVFVALGLLSLIPLACMRGIRARPTPAELSPAAPAGDRRTGERRLPVVLAGFVAVYLLHFAVQSGIGNWEPTHLHALGHSVTSATAATSAYWLAMTVGRFLVAPLARRWSPATIVTASCALMTVSVLLVMVPGMTPWAYAAAGLCIGPIFPNGLNWLNRSAPASGSAMAYVIAAAMLGSVAFPPALGAAIEEYGVGSLPVMLSGLCLTTVVISAALAGRLRGTRQQTAAHPATPSPQATRTTTTVGTTATQEKGAS
ncbi:MULTISPECIES: MFS transporter [unclassified Streptomyces]|uniref:MFS transporter n=1 Tax=unclassified Streptomyces TaxID=2593676 RepID=UPI00037D087A|nr:MULTISPECIES: MFS transporter [unclassified Streptomyces]MYT33086.1 MFS transporter [Streptomyces sp. SID8354]